MVGDQRPQLAHGPGVAAGGDADVDTLGHDHDVPSIEYRGRLDVLERAVGCERPFDRTTFATSGKRPRPRDNRDFVKHDGNVLDEHRIGKV